MGSIEENIRKVHERVAAAAHRAGRDPSEITIVAVTKTFAVDMVEAVVAGGIADIGENRVQELLTKQEQVRAACRWHLVGTLQRNKVSKVVGRVAMIHSIDSVRLAETIDRVAAENGERVRVLLQVNTSGESQKHGFAPGEVMSAVEAVAPLAQLDVAGLMTIGPATRDEGDTRDAFQLLRSLRDRAASETGTALPHLSMGMSGDFETAIEEGATIVRLGSVITGPRG